MIEYRTEKVDPSVKDDVIEVLSAFGWKAISSEEIYKEDTEVVGVDVKSYGNGIVGSFMRGFTGKDGEVNVRKHTTVTNYVELKFARDTEMQGYSQVKALNEEFENKMNVSAPHKPIIRTAVCVIGIALIIVSIILALIQNTSTELWEIIVCVVFPIVTILLTIIGWKHYKKELAIYEDTCSRLNEILTQSLNIVFDKGNKID